MRCFFLGILLLISCAASANTTIAVVGDSLSAGYGIDINQGWVALLQRRLNAVAPGHYHVVNASVSGDTSADGLRRLPQVLAKHQPAIVLLELGANDGLRGFPLKTSKRNLQAIIQRSTQAGATVVLIGIHLPPNYGAFYSKAFDQMYTQIATQQQLPFVPFLLQDVATHPELMQADGLHPNAQAQSIMENTVWSVLQAQILEDASN